MAKKSSVEKNKKRMKLIEKYKTKREELKRAIYDKSLSIEERFSYVLKLAQLPVDSSFTRKRNRCNITGKPRGYYRRFGLSRIQLREFASQGHIPGVVTSSW